MTTNQTAQTNEVKGMMIMSGIGISLVKYAGEHWVTLSDYTATRKLEGYSGMASVKAAVRTFVVKNDPDKYIVFRGEPQIKGIIEENENNPLFHVEKFDVRKGQTRCALIHISMIDALGKQFKIKDEAFGEWEHFVLAANKYINNTKKEEVPTNPILESRSKMQREITLEMEQIQARIMADKLKLGKLQAAYDALAGLDL
jgi:hypothetical protein